MTGLWLRSSKRKGRVETKESKRRYATIMISSRSFSSDTHREKIVRNQETKMQVLCIKREKEREKEKRKGKKEAEKH